MGWAGLHIWHVRYKLSCLFPLLLQLLSLRRVSLIADVGGIGYIMRYESGSCTKLPEYIWILHVSARDEMLRGLRGAFGRAVGDGIPMI